MAPNQDTRRSNLWRLDNRLESRFTGLRDPCPDGDGKFIGTYQTFKVACDREAAGSSMKRVPANNLTDCVDLCSASKKKCYSVSFDVNREGGIANCYFKQGTGLENSDDRIVDAATLVYEPTATSDCSNIGPTYTADKANYEVMCGMDMPGSDTETVPANSMAECMDACSKKSLQEDQTRCVGVTYTSNRDYMFFNCWLKYNVNKMSIVSTKEGKKKVVDFAFLLSTTSSATMTGCLSSSATASTKLSASTTVAQDETLSNNPTSSDSKSSDPTSSDASSSGNKISGGTIGGAVTGGVVALGLIGLLVLFFMRRRRSAKNKDEFLESKPSSEALDDGTIRHEIGYSEPANELESRERVELPGNTLHEWGQRR